MKKIIFSMLALVLLMGVNAQSWNYVSSTGTTFILYGMSFPPGQNDVGYACGMQYTYDADGIIIKTTDGGDNWTQVWPASGDIDGLQGIWFISDSVGFAGGWNNYFIKTADAGATWTPVSCGTNVWYYTDVVFWDANNGVACAYMNASDQCVFVTADGGDNWTQASSGVPGTMMGIAYADQNTLFGVNTGGNVYKSTDGGYNWTVSSTLPALLFGVEFADVNFGVIGAEEKIFATNDGGSSWTTYTTGYENFYATKAFTDGTAYVGGTDENIYVTNDYGVTWSTEHNGSGSSSLYRIRFTPNGTLTACGSGGTIIQKEPVLLAAFSADNTDVCEGDVVNFTDQSVGTPISWDWTFEGGTPATSTVQNPSVTYNTAGTYDVTLEVSDGSLVNTSIETDYISVSEIPAQATIPVGPDTVCEGEMVDYTTTAVPGATTYTWVVDPSDAGSIAGAGTTGTFTAATDWTGDYIVKVMAENACGAGAYSPDLSATLFHTPESFILGGGGGYCEGLSGLELTLDGSETGVDYELFLSNVSTGIIIAGTGDSISFGYQTEQGLYTASGFTASCSQDMMGQPYISIILMPVDPDIPVGPDAVCNNAITTYTTTGSQHADTLIWVLDPADAGTLTPGTDLVEVEWSASFIGTAYLSLYGSNECGDSSPSPELEITVNEAPAPEISGLTVVCEDDVTDYSTIENPGNTYAWVVEGGSITAGAGTNQITVQWGSYGMGYVRVLENNGTCVDSTENYVVQIDECPGIDEMAVSEVRLYPNPANTTITIEFQGGNEKEYELNVWNIHGKLMESAMITTGQDHLDLNVSDYSAGTYFIEMKNQSKTYSKLSFVVNH
ncbi:MAG: T9SS type A sorting domain-containing protein [Bacteroidota bacterium]